MAGADKNTTKIVNWQGCVTEICWEKENKAGYQLKTEWFL